MVTINIAGSGHLVPMAEGNARWLAYDGTLTDQQHYLELAIRHLQDHVANLADCNACYQRLPGGRTFAEVLADPAIFISYCPDLHAYGYTNGNNVTVCQQAFDHRQSVQMIAGTLIHELAHVNGAPGGRSRAAEETLIPCLNNMYNPMLRGSRDTPPSGSRLA